MARSSLILARQVKTWGHALGIAHEGLSAVEEHDAEIWIAHRVGPVVDVYCA